MKNNYSFTCSNCKTAMELKKFHDINWNVFNWDNDCKGKQFLYLGNKRKYEIEDINHINKTIVLKNIEPEFKPKIHKLEDVLPVVKYY